MTDPSAERPARPARGARGGIVTWLLLALVIVVAAGGAFWWFFVRSDAKPAPQLRTTGTVPGGSLDGSWRLLPNLGSFAQYRVQEQFAADIVQSDATGRTTEVSGDMTVNNATVSNVRVQADMTKLVSDKQMRDNKLKTTGLETNQFPTATFVLTQPIQLKAPPAKGEKVTADATGDLTLHGVTKRVTMPLEGRWDGETVQVVGKIPITFADYGITPPNIGGFVTVADKGRMELELNFVKS
jgi:polyisoprenoid-binding protein YceI